MSVQTVGIVFGGLSTEHEVSIITSLQAAAALDRVIYAPVALYLAKDGSWYTGEELLNIDNCNDLPGLLRHSIRFEIVPGAARHLHMREVKRSGLFSGLPQQWKVDVLFLGLHGGSGENGSMQGFCELMDIPYTGSGVLASALAMDKVRAKTFCKAYDIPVVPSKRIREKEWAGNETRWLDDLSSSPCFPLSVKPVKLGSSIGICRVEGRDELDKAIEEAYRYDEEVVVEMAVTSLREINCSVLGDEDDAIASVLEEPIARDGFLSYEDKYVADGPRSKANRSAKTSGSPGGMAAQDRMIPARLPDELTERIKTMAIRIFKLLGCAGVVRIDFLMNGESGAVYFNEINTIPGSFSFYLWEPSGVPFDELVTRLIKIGLHRYESRSNRVRFYDVNLLAEHASRGLKGAKS